MTPYDKIDPRLSNMVDEFIKQRNNVEILFDEEDDTWCVCFYDGYLTTGNYTSEQAAQDDLRAWVLWYFSPVDSVKAPDEE